MFGWRHFALIHFDCDVFGSVGVASQSRRDELFFSRAKEIGTKGRERRAQEMENCYRSKSTASRLLYTVYAFVLLGLGRTRSIDRRGFNGFHSTKITYCAQ